MIYLVATPIGNLDDFTQRGINTLKNVDIILCEDTRQTRKLLNHYKIEKELISFNEHADERKFNKVLELIEQGKNLAFVSDAGTPNISDPGAKLINLIKEKTEIIPIPGASALTTIVSVADIPMDKFIFLGFPPVKKGRKKFFEQIEDSKYPIIIYESPHRIEKTLNELGEKECIVGRELTKKFEEISRGRACDLVLKVNKKGEFVILVK